MSEDHISDFIEEWLLYSRIFYLSFRVKEQLGLLWFLIHYIIVADDNDDVNVRSMNSLCAQFKAFGSKDVSSAIFHLMELGYVKIEDKNQQPITTENEKARKRNTAFPLDWEVTFLPSIRKKGSEYGFYILTILFGAREAHRIRRSDPSAMGRAVQFYFRETARGYIPVWEGLIVKLFSVAKKVGIPADYTKHLDSLKGRMLDATEPYIVFHLLWLQLLSGNTPFTEKTVYDMHQNIRVVALKKLREVLKTFYFCQFVKAKAKNVQQTPDTELTVNGDAYGLVMKSHSLDFGNFFETFDQGIRAEVTTPAT